MEGDNHPFLLGQGDGADGGEAGAAGGAPAGGAPAGGAPADDDLELDPTQDTPRIRQGRQMLAGRNRIRDPPQRTHAECMAIIDALSDAERDLTRTNPFHPVFADLKLCGLANCTFTIDPVIFMVDARIDPIHQGIYDQVTKRMSVHLATHTAKMSQERQSRQVGARRNRPMLQMCCMPSEYRSWEERFMLYKGDGSWSSQQLWTEIVLSLSDDCHKVMTDQFDATKWNITALTEMIRRHIVRGSDVFNNRQAFMSLNQMESETVMCFATRLRAQSRDCRFEITLTETFRAGEKIDFSEQLITTKFLTGVSNGDISDRLYQMSPTSPDQALPTMDELLDTAEKLENAQIARGDQKGGRCLFAKKRPPRNTPQNKKTPDSKNKK